MRQIWILENLNFKISRGSMPPDPPSVPAPLALDSILTGPTLNCFRRACNTCTLTSFQLFFYLGTRTKSLAGFRGCRCLRNYHRMGRFDRCWPCPPEFGTYCAKDLVVLRKGFAYPWLNRTDEIRFLNFSLNIENEDGTYDKNYSSFDGTIPLVHPCPRTSSCPGGIREQCAEG